MRVDIHAVNFNGNVLDDEYSAPFENDRDAVQYALRQFVASMNKKGIVDIRQVAVVAMGRNHVFTWLEAVCL